MISTIKSSEPNNIHETLYSTISSSCVYTISLSYFYIINLQQLETGISRDKASHGISHVHQLKKIENSYEISIPTIEYQASKKYRTETSRLKKTKKQLDKLDLIYIETRRNRNKIRTTWQNKPFPLREVFTRVFCRRVPFVLLVLSQLLHPLARYLSRFLRHSFNDIMEDRILRNDVFIAMAANQNFR